MGPGVRWGHVWTIFWRETRDQLRDRRTLFMVVVLPLLLYPLLIAGLLQVVAASQQKARTVVVVGSEYLPDSPRLLNDRRDGFDPALFDVEGDAARLKVDLATPGWDWTRPGAVREGLRDRLADAVVVVPPDLKGRIEAVGPAELPIHYDSTVEVSQITYSRTRDVLMAWRDRIVKDRLARDGKPPGYNRPVEVRGEDVAPKGEAGGSVWGQILPFLLVIMTLTGAFYPAVDLCAGEKERGTMETLLISPASRTEIVLGKFFTVMLAAMTTATLNLASMGLTGIQAATRAIATGSKGSARLATALAPPNPSSYVWMILLLIPLAALFAALSVALATMARSVKEGSYYMTPLYIVTMPLVLVTMSPDVSLSLFYSLVPIAGPSLLLKALVVGEYGAARLYFAPVLVATLAYAAMAIRWAVDLFRREDVVFREAEAFDPMAWLRHVLVHKEPRPSSGSAIFCFALMISLAYFVTQSLTSVSPLRGMVIGHLAFILAPPVVLAFLLTSDPLGTLRLRRPTVRDLGLALGLALALNPVVRELGFWSGRWFPASEPVRAMLDQLGKQIPSWGVAVLVFAAMPAITEELAFRGYILSGLERSYSNGTAIVLSSLLFGFLHVLLSLFQQFFGAAALGLVLGLLAIRSGSLWPGVVFHFVNNALGVLTAEAAGHPRLATASAWLFRDRAEGLYRPVVLAVSASVAAALLYALWRGPSKPTAPEDRPGPSMP